MKCKACIFYVDDLRGETMVPPNKKLDDLIHLAELCVDLLQQNEEHYAEVSFMFNTCDTQYKNLEYSI